MNTPKYITWLQVKAWQEANATGDKFSFAHRLAVYAQCDLALKQLNIIRTANLKDLLALNNKDCSPCNEMQINHVRSYCARHAN